MRYVCGESDSFVSLDSGGCELDWTDNTMSHQVVRVRREAVAPCMTCPLCRRLFRDATTISECLHTFCRKCIYKKLSDDEMESCPICNIDLGCVPLEKLRPDHKLQDVRTKLFPYKRIEAKAPEIVVPVALPAKRKERSLSSLVVSTPRVSSTQNGMTGRRSKSIARKTSRGSGFTIEKTVKKDDDSLEDYSESSGSPETLNKFAQSTKQKSVACEPSNHRSPNQKRENGCDAWEGKVDLWKPLDCLVEAANRTKSSKFSIQGSTSKYDALHDNEGFSNTKNKEQKPKAKVQDERNSGETAPEPERSKKLRRSRQKKTQNFGELRTHPQVVLDAASFKFERGSYPIWFSLVPDEQERKAPPLPQIAASYIRIKDGSIPVSFIHNYIKMKLELASEDEVEIKCMGQRVIPTLTLSNLAELWLQTTTTGVVSAAIGSSAKDFVMVLGYSRKVPDS